MVVSGTILYGPRYVGTTSLAEEMGLQVWEICPESIHSWEYFKNLVDGGEFKQKRIAIDKLDSLYEMCVQYICDQENCEHPSDMGTGKAGVWRKIKEEYSDALYELSSQAMEVWFICSAKTSSVSHSFYTGDVWMPKLDWISEDILPNITERTLAYLPVFKTLVNPKNGKTRRKESRTLICSIRPDVYAGDSSGLLPATIPADGDAKQTAKIIKEHLDA